MFENHSRSCRAWQYKQQSQDSQNGISSRDKTFKAIQGATHYYAGQPGLLQEAVYAVLDWLESRKLLD
jgi:hypothetical protein